MFRILQVFSRIVAMARSCYTQRPREGRRRVTPRQKPDETSSRTDAAASATQAPMTIELTITPAQAAQNCAGQLGRNYGPCREQIALVDQRQSGIPAAAPGATAVMAAARAVAVMVVLAMLEAAVVVMAGPEVPAGPGEAARSSAGQRVIRSPRRSSSCAARRERRLARGRDPRRIRVVLVAIAAWLPHAAAQPPAPKVN
jgi:hypothetical protein